MKTLYEIVKNVKITRASGLIGCILIALLVQSCVSTAYVPERRTTVVRREVAPPPWAPPYENVHEVHYYYLPDIEVYYDVWNHEYIYLNNGSWVYTREYPSYYSSYDINSAYVVVLDAKVSDPWRHHNVYVSHYPRYYYRSVYDDDGRYRDHNRRNDNRDYNAKEYRGNVRGFNENAKTPIYRNGAPSNNSNRRYTMPNNNNNSNYSGNERSRPARRSETRGENENRTTVNPNPSTNQNSQRSTRQENENVTAPGRRTENSQPANNVERRTENQQNAEVKSGRTDNNNQNNQNRNTEQTQRSQPVVYPGKEVGQPVRVRRDMQPAKEERKQVNVQQRATQIDDSKSKKDDSKKEEDKSSRRRRN